MDGYISKHFFTHSNFVASDSSTELHSSPIRSLACAVVCLMSEQDCVRKEVANAGAVPSKYMNCNDINVSKFVFYTSIVMLDLYRMWLDLAVNQIRDAEFLHCISHKPASVQFFACSICKWLSSRESNSLLRICNLRSVQANSKSLYFIF